MRSASIWRAALFCTAAVIIQGCAGSVDGGGDDNAEADTTGEVTPDARAATTNRQPPTSSSTEKDAGVALEVAAYIAPDGGSDAPVGATMDDAGSPVDTVARAPEILPVVMLTVTGKKPETLTGTKVTGSIAIIEDHNGTHQDLAGRPRTLDSLIGISLRGSSSLGFPQKSFSIELRDAAGAEKKAVVLGMPTQADWALVACWADKPCMRNAIAYSLAAQFGRWSPRLRFVEAFFNGSYIGLYQLVEVPRQDKDRIPLPKTGTVANSLELTGGYVFRRESTGKSPARDWISPVTSPDQWLNKMVYTFHYPKETVITPEQKAYLTAHMTKFETMMKSADWADPTRGYPAFLDVTTFADYVVLNEGILNVDAYWKSIYWSKQRDPMPGVMGKLMMFPPWDYNLSMGNGDWRNMWKTDTMVYKDRGGECSDELPKGPPYCVAGSCCVTAALTTAACQPPNRCFNIPYVPFYWDRLWSDAPFKNAVKCRWQDLRKANYNIAFVDARIREYKAMLEPLAIPRHFARWPQLRGYVWPNPYKVNPTSFPPANSTVTQGFEYETTWMRNWLDRRLTWLDTNLPGTCAQ